MANIKGLLEKYKKIEGERFFDETFNNKEYDAVKDLKPNVVIDVGATAGEFTSWIYDRAQVIYAIEPCTAHFVELIENITDFGLIDKVKAYHLAIAGENGVRNLELTGRGGNRLSGSPSNNTEEVQGKTIATFMREEGITHVDLLKIDVEDAEAEIFRAKDFIEVADKIDVIMGEHLSLVDNQLLGCGFEKRRTNRGYIYERKHD